MRKKSLHTKKRRIATTPLHSSLFQRTIGSIADAQMTAQRALTPIICAKHLSPSEAVILITIYADALLLGKTPQNHSMSEDDLQGAFNLLIKLWTSGKFTPGPDYPYTLEQTLADINDKDVSL